MSSEKQYQGRCFCGAVELRVTGEPAAMGYCHCESCQQWSASPVNAFTLWSPSAVTITRGADQLVSFSKTERSIRKWCKSCGGHVLTVHPGWDLIDVYSAVLPDLPFKAMLHVNYQDSVLRIKDGLPKQKDFPAEMGGSGVLLPE
ncbi:MAG TPA: GFA family protein [Polyangiaceae bacterium]|nr:GFA family protein [Polyangiaceae bacterium]